MDVRKVLLLGQILGLAYGASVGKEEYDGINQAINEILVIEHEEETERAIQQARTELKGDSLHGEYKNSGEAMKCPEELQNCSDAVAKMLVLNDLKGYLRADNIKLIGDNSNCAGYYELRTSYNYEDADGCDMFKDFGNCKVLSMDVDVDCNDEIQIIKIVEPIRKTPRKKGKPIPEYKDEDVGIEEEEGR